MEVNFNARPLHRETTYEDLKNSGDLLVFLSENDIHSVEKFQKIVNETNTKYQATLQYMKRLINDINYMLDHPSDENRRILPKAKIRLDETQKELKKLHDRAEEVNRVYKTFLQENGVIPYDNDYEVPKPAPVKKAKEYVGRNVMLEYGAREDVFYQFDNDSYNSYRVLRETDDEVYVSPNGTSTGSSFWARKSSIISVS